MKSRVLGLFAEAIAGGIVFAGLVAVAYALTGRWPPQAATIGASIGGMMSPAFWGWVERRRSRRPTDAPGETP